MSGVHSMQLSGLAFTSGGALQMRTAPHATLSILGSYVDSNDYGLLESSGSHASHKQLQRTGTLAIGIIMMLQQRKAGGRVARHAKAQKGMRLKTEERSQCEATARCGTHALTHADGQWNPDKDSGRRLERLVHKEAGLQQVAKTKIHNQEAREIRKCSDSSAGKLNTLMRLAINCFLLMKIVQMFGLSHACDNNDVIAIFALMMARSAYKHNH